MVYSLHSTLRSAIEVSVRKLYFCHPHFTGRVAKALGDCDFSKVNSRVQVFFYLLTFIAPFLPPSLPSCGLLLQFFPSSNFCISFYCSTHGFRTIVYHSQKTWLSAKYHLSFTKMQADKDLRRKLMFLRNYPLQSVI